MGLGIGLGLGLGLGVTGRVLDGLRLTGLRAVDAEDTDAAVAAIGAKLALNLA